MTVRRETSVLVRQTVIFEGNDHIITQDPPKERLISMKHRHQLIPCHMCMCLQSVQHTFNTCRDKHIRA